MRADTLKTLERFFKSINANENFKEAYTIAVKRIIANEEKYGKNIWDFSTKQLIDSYKALCSHSETYIEELNRKMKNFVNFCIMENMVDDNQNHANEITDSMISKFCINIALLKSKIVTREELLSNLKFIQNDCDKFVVLAYFEGISGNECSDFEQLSLDSLDQENKVWTIPYIHRHNGVVKEVIRRIPVSDELIRLAIASANTYEYVLSDGRVRKLKSEDPYVIKCYGVKGKGEFAKADTVRRKIKATLNDIDLSCATAKDLNTSGKIDYINQFIKAENAYDDPVNCILSHYDEIQNKYLTKIKSAVSFYNKYKEYIGV